MEDNYDSSFNLRESMEEYTEKNENENFRNDEPKNVNSNSNGSIVVNPNCNNSINNNYNINNNCYNFQFNYKNEYNENFFFNNSNTCIEKQTNYDNLHNTEINDIHRNYNNKKADGPNSEEVLINTQNYENIENKKTATNTYENTFNGKQIYVLNDLIAGSFKELLNTTEINLDTKKDMQLLRKKNKRRTKFEIQKEKEKISKSEEKKKSLGRKKLTKEEKTKLTGHSKISDDNIMKKINSYFLESIRNWLNKSFIDENGLFQNIRVRKKLKKMFLKIDPKIITINLKRKTAINVMNMKFKDIFFAKISRKYMINKESENKILIEEIYRYKNQPFTLFILELKFIEALNFFNGQNNEDDLKILFYKNNFDKDIINQFINNFDRIDKFLKEIYDKEIKYGNSKEEIEDYLQRISLLCLNYKEWFDKKFNRGENKKKPV
jgi:hypothetical protein